MFVDAHFREENVQKSYTYQHIQGVMLVNLNKLANRFSLTHSQYHLLGVLIGFWNYEKGHAFPSIDCLAQMTSMGKATILKALTALEELNLITIEKVAGSRNHYYFNNCFFANCDTHSTRTTGVSACKTTHVIKQNRIRTDLETSIKTLKKQINLNNPNDISFKSILERDKPKSKDFKRDYSCFLGNRIFAKLIEASPARAPVR